MLETWSGPKKALIGTLIALVPPALGLAIPGGLVGDSVSLDFETILLTTLPWSLSIAFITWLWLAWTESEGVKFGASVAVLAVGAALALVTTPEFEVSADRVDNPLYAFASKAPSQAIVQGGRVASHNPRATGVALAVGAAVFIAFAYALLYGFPLWLAGIGCGIYFGYVLHNGLTAAANSPPAGGH